MTLFEVAIALLITSTAIVTLALLYPVGIKAQQLARYRLYASAKALELLDTFANDQHARISRQIEAQHPAQNTLMRWQPDLERKMEDPLMGLLPLPRAIAQRLDSDDDAIAALIADGGQVFYCPPQTYDFAVDQRGGGNAGVVAEAQAMNRTLLFAVIGYAQQNALPNHPCLAWPYYDFYPSPQQAREIEEWTEQGWPALTEALAVGAVVDGETYHAAHGDAPTIDAYVLRAQQLVAALGIPTTGSAGGPVPVAPAPLPATWSAGDPAVYPAPWTILALRYLAHAAMARTGTGATPPLTPTATPAQIGYGAACHEACLAWVMRYAATSAYDWGAPRPLNRQTCFDFPLLQFDLFSPPLVSPSPDSDVCYRVISAQAPLVNPTNAWRSHGSDGWSAMPDNRVGISGSWGDNRNFSLVARFDPAERTRRLICWSADWQAYADVEELPADAFDAANAFLDSRGVPVSSERTGYPPDVFLHFRDAGRTSRFPTADHNDSASPRTGLWNTLAYKQEYLGVHGVDRNGNGRYDRGPLPPSTRIRASTVVAYDFYDRRLIAALRN